MEDISKVDIEEEIQTLKDEAVALLDSMFNLPKNISSKEHSRFVECIISATLLEIVNLNKQSLKR